MKISLLHIFLYIAKRVDLMKKALISVFVSISLIFSLCPSAFADASFSVSAKSAILIDADTLEVLYHKDAYTKRPMASTTKIMTALICLESERKGERFEVDKEAIKTEGSSMGLLEGDKVTLSQLAIGMLMLSGNDAANAAAVKISGSLTEFARLMNSKANEIGMKSTNFVTPSGLHDDKHYSTAYDMALLGAYALKNAEFVEISSKSKYTLSYGEPKVTRTFSNHNRLVREIEGCIGIKTGFTKKAGRCLVSAVKKNGRTLVCVTLSAPNDWSDHKKLYEYGFSLYKETTNFDVKLPDLPIVNSENGSIPLKAAEKSPTLYLKSGEKVTTKTFLYPFEYAPVYKGQIIGELYYCVGDTILYQTELVAAKSAHHLYEKSKSETKSPFEKLLSWLKSLFK